jgi:hypothetical protein
MDAELTVGITGLHLHYQHTLSGGSAHADNCKKESLSCSKNNSSGNCCKSDPRIANNKNCCPLLREGVSQSHLKSIEYRMMSSQDGTSGSLC